MPANGPPGRCHAPLSQTVFVRPPKKESPTRSNRQTGMLLPRRDLVPELGLGGLFQALALPDPWSKSGVRSC